MNNKKDDLSNSDLLGVSSDQFDQNRGTSKATYRYIMLFFFVIIATLAILLLFRYIEYKIPDMKRPTNSDNPLLLMERQDEGSLTIPDVKVYDAERDLNDLDEDRLQREEEFTQVISSSPESNSDMIIKRDQFASKKLYLLKKIEASKTKEERLKYIKALQIELGDSK